MLDVMLEVSTIFSQALLCLCWFWQLQFSRTIKPFSSRREVELISIPWRTGAYRLNSDDSWTPLLDWVNSTNWHDWGVDAIATDPVDPERLYLAVGAYTISWDPNNGQILRSTDQGATWASTNLPFKVGGNMPGRGIGERLAVDPNSNNILYFGARSGHGLWKSVDYGVTWNNVTAFHWVGTYFANASNVYTADIDGLAWVTFDSTSGTAGSPTPRIFVGEFAAFGY